MTLSTSARTNWRGVTVDERTAAMLTELAATTGPAIVPTQGAFRPSTSYSAGTHTGAGAVDLSVAAMSRDEERAVEAQARRLGFAAWVRAAIAGVWGRHMHLIAVPPAGRSHNDGGLAADAWAQVLDYFAGRDGLAGHGPDTGSRADVGATFETYLSATTTELEVIDMAERIFNTSGDRRDVAQDTALDLQELVRADVPGGRVRDVVGHVNIEAAGPGRLEVYKRLGDAVQDGGPIGAQAIRGAGLTTTCTFNTRMGPGERLVAVAHAEGGPVAVTHIAVDLFHAVRPL